MANVLFLDFHGVSVSIETSSKGLLKEIERDFSYFKVGEADPCIKISLFQHNPPYEKVPNVKASLYKPNAVAYDQGDRRYVVYNKSALTIYNYSNKEGEIYCKDSAYLHELTYLLIHSTIGKALDLNGLHRIHGMGFEYKGTTGILLLPAGGGKTTMALNLLERDGFKLVSEDTPLITRDLDILPFPIRLGVSGELKTKVPKEFIRIFKRSEHGPKTLIDIEYLGDNIAGKSRLDIILIGERCFAKSANISNASWYNALPSLSTNIIIGLGLPQILEHLFRFSLKDLSWMLNVGFSRMITSIKALYHAKTYFFSLGTDVGKNADTLIEFLVKEIEAD